MYEQILDEVTSLSWTHSSEKDDEIDSLKELKVHQLVQSPKDTLSFLVNALQEGSLFRRATAIEIIDRIGYPANEPAILPLLAEIGLNDPNSPVWSFAVITLSHIGIDNVTPYLVWILLDHKIFLQSYTNLSWEEFIGGLRMLLCRTYLGSEWAIRCCPAINYLLSHMEEETMTIEATIDLLAIIEKAGDHLEYLIPTLCTLSQKYQGSIIGNRSMELLSIQDKKALADYRLIRR